MNNIKTKLSKLTSLTLATIMLGSSLSPLTVLAESGGDIRGGEMRMMGAEEGKSIEDKIPDENLKKAIREALGVPIITDENILNLTRLDANNKNIKDIIGINYATNLQTLNLNNNQLTKLDSQIFKGLTNLQNLLINNNQLATIDQKAFEGLISLQYLYLSGNQLTNIVNKTFEGLTSIDTISIANNKLKNIDPQAFEGLTSLQTIWLDDNQLTKLDSATFKGLSSLINLFLSDNQLEKIDSATFGGLTKLQNLGLNNNQLETLDPRTFNDLIKVHDLRISNNKLTKLDPTTFNNLTSLQSLILDHNQLTSLDPTTFNGLTKINGLNLGYNQLTNIDFLNNLNLTRYKNLSNQNIHLPMLERVQELPTITNNPKFVKANEADKYKIVGNKVVLDDDYAGKEIKIKFTTDDIGKENEKDNKAYGFSGTITIDTSQVKPLEAQTFNPIILQEEVSKGQPIDLTDNIQNLPNGATITDITNPVIDTNTVGNYTGKVRITFADGSTKEVKISVKVVLQAGTIIPVPIVDNENIKPEIVDWGKKIDLTDNIEHLLEGSEVKDITNPVIDTTKSGNYTGKVEVAFQDGSKRIIEIPVIVNKSQSENFIPEIDKTQVKANKGEEINPADKIINLPEGTQVEVLTPIVADETEDKTGKVKITFPDGSTKEVEITIPVEIRTESDTLKPEFDKTPVVVTKGDKVNIVDRLLNKPEGATVVEVTPIDTTTEGQKEGTIRITFKDGSVKDYVVTVLVKFKEEKPFVKPNFRTSVNNWNIGQIDIDKPKDKSELTKIKSDIESEKDSYYKAEAQNYWIFKIGDYNYRFVNQTKTTTRTADIQPFIKNDRAYLPFRFVGDAINVDVSYDNKTRLATFKKNGNTLNINIDTKKATLNGQPYELETDPLIIKGRLVAPVSVIGKAFNKTTSNKAENKNTDIVWNNETKEVVIYNYK